MSLGALRHDTSGRCGRRPSPVRLGEFENRAFTRGRSKLTEFLWLLVQATFITSWIPGSLQRRWILRMFGARIGRGVVIKPRVRIKFPWRLQIGDNSWIGEAVWIDNLESVEIGANCCLSQDAYLCTGSHDWRSPQFDLVVRSIKVEDGAWLAARSVVAPGVTIHEGAVLGLGGVATADLKAWMIYQGAPAKALKQRQIV